MAWTLRYIRADAAGGGDGTTDAASGANGAWTIAEALATAALGVPEIRYIKAGTYASATSFGISLATATATAPVWWKGFNATPGDLDAATDETNFPWFDFSSNAILNVTGGYMWVSQIKITSPSVTGAAVNWAGPTGRFFRNHVTGEAADVDNNALMLTSSADDSAFYENYLTCNAAATVISASASANCSIFGNYCLGGLIGISMASTTPCFGNIVNNPASHGIYLNQAASIFAVKNNSIYSAGGSGIYIQGADNGTVIANNIIEGSDAFGIAAAASTSHATILHNLFYANTSGNLSNILEDYAIGNQTDSASPFTNAAAGDFTLKSTSLGKGAAYPGGWLGLSGNLSYGDIGAVHRQEPAAGGGVYYG